MWVFVCRPLTHGVFRFLVVRFVAAEQPTTIVHPVPDMTAWTIWRLSLSGIFLIAAYSGNYKKKYPRKEITGLIASSAYPHSGKKRDGGRLLRDDHGDNSSIRVYPPVIDNKQPQLQRGPGQALKLGAATQVSNQCPGRTTSCTPTGACVHWLAGSSYTSNDRIDLACNLTWTFNACR